MTEIYSAQRECRVVRAVRETEYTYLLTLSNSSLCFRRRSIIASSSSSSSISMSSISCSLELSERSALRPSDKESLYLSLRSLLLFRSLSRSRSLPCSLICCLSRSLRLREGDRDLLLRSFRSLSNLVRVGLRDRRAVLRDRSPIP